MSKKYTELVSDILEHVGGKENIITVKHCITRLRFNLKDESKANTEFLKQREGIVTVVSAGGQYQVVIGNNVPDVYKEFVEIAGLEENNSDTKEVNKDKGNLFNKFVDLVSGIFQPVLGVLAGTGIIKGLVAILSATLGWNSTNSALYSILEATGDGFFQFLPIVLAYTASKKLDLNPFSGLAIAMALVYPTLPANLVKLKEAGLDNVYGIPFQLPGSGSYLSSVIPIILAVWLGANVEKFAKKIIPDVVKLFLVPVLTLIVTVPATFLVVGPAASFVSELLTVGFKAVMDFNPIIFGALLGFLWQILVMFGLHWAIIPMAILQFAQQGWSDILMGGMLPNFAQTGVLLAILLKTKEAKVKQVAMPATISSIFGVTEPAIYGVTLPMKIPFYISCGVSALIGAVVAFFELKSFMPPALGIFMLPSFVGPDTGLYPMYVAAGLIVATIAISFAVQMLAPVPYLYGEPEEKVVTNRETTGEKETREEIITSPLSGKVVELTDVPDKVFADGGMGKGIAIDPVEGVVVSPAKAEVVTVFPTGHALGLRTEQGTEIIIHVGIDTVSLSGKGFESLVKVGDKVQVGQELLRFDLATIKEAGLSALTPVVVTNSRDFGEVLTTKEKEIKVGDYLLTAK